ncbi:DUF3014 domain-containing protein [Psychrosphaera sp. B3R10]|uniref:DUF3014 domain-containing protein n=1 Tax=unclassified Psychrosphaera TaxID=2641570 RepID=UPI001C085231|nr:MULTISPECIES: DUF3014 domain-containing protein [unclassified Psychrosphaera]MBU2882413.1 DUF3014 domain-containing protein [Psychrosphaera sp. I2R16]MBU2990232.1 DUF3014 domain-containing protein [Psychrosphaera sp. B3R10]
METSGTEKKPLPIAVYAGAVAIILAGVVWVAMSPGDNEPEKPTPIVKMPEPVILPEIEKEAPEMVEPEPELAEITIEPEPEVEPEPPKPAHPPLMESDNWFRAELTDLVMGTPAIKKVVQENIISNFVVFIDNAAKGEIVRKFSPVVEPEGKFKATLLEGPELKYVLNEQSYKRYDMYADLITALPIDASDNLYDTLSPLVEEAYFELGYSENDFNDKVLETIDILMETPIVDGDINLVTPSAMFEFADKKLEALLPIQKLFLRMGPDNQRKILPVLEEIKAKLEAKD